MLLPAGITTETEGASGLKQKRNGCVEIETALREWQPNAVNRIGKKVFKIRQSYGKREKLLRNDAGKVLRVVFVHLLLLEVQALQPVQILPKCFFCSPFKIIDYCNLKTGTV